MKTMNDIFSKRNDFKRKKTTKYTGTFNNIGRLVPLSFSLLLVDCLPTCYHWFWFVLFTFVVERFGGSLFGFVLQRQSFFPISAVFWKSWKSQNHFQGGNKYVCIFLNSFLSIILPIQIFERSKLLFRNWWE